MKSDFTLEVPAAGPDQIVSRVRFADARSVGRARADAAGPGERVARDVEFRASRSARERLDRVPIAVAAREVHRREITPRPEFLVYETHILEERGPVERRHQPHARDDVSHRHGHCGLPLVLDESDLVGRRSLRGEALVQPGERWGYGRIAIAKPLDEFHRKRRDQPRIVVARRYGGKTRCSYAAESEEFVGERVGFLTRGTPAHDRVGEAAEVLHENDAQRDRQRPQLTDRERLHFLIGAHEPLQRIRIEAAVGVRDVRPCDTIYAREPLVRSTGQRRQFAIKPDRQVVANFAQLLVHNKEVVDQPLGGRSNPPLFAQRAGDRAVRIAQDAAILLHARQKRTLGAGPAGHLLRGGEACRVLLEPLHAEQFRANRIFERRERRKEEGERGLHLHAISARAPPSGITRNDYDISMTRRRVYDQHPRGHRHSYDEGAQEEFLSQAFFAFGHCSVPQISVLRCAIVRRKPLIAICSRA